MYCKEKCSDWKMCERKSCKKAPSADSAASQLGFKRDFEDDQWSFFTFILKCLNGRATKASVCKMCSFMEFTKGIISENAFLSAKLGLASRLKYLQMLKQQLAFVDFSKLYDIAARSNLIVDRDLN